MRVSDSNGECGDLCVAAVKEPNNAHEGEEHRVGQAIHKSPSHHIQYQALDGTFQFTGSSTVYATESCFWKGETS